MPTVALVIINMDMACADWLMSSLSQLFDKRIEDGINVMGSDQIEPSSQFEDEVRFPVITQAAYEQNWCSVRKDMMGAGWRTDAKCTTSRLRCFYLLNNLLTRNQN